MNRAPTPVAVTSTGLKEDHVIVVMVWSTEHGPCHDCGLPAAYTEDERRLCSVCAAQTAADGYDIQRLAFQGVES